MKDIATQGGDMTEAEVLAEAEAEAERNAAEAGEAHNAG